MWSASLSRRPARLRTRRPRSTRPGLEVLEDRTVPSGVNVVSGDPNDWPMFGHDPEGTRYNSAETRLRPDNVGGLQELWRYPTEGAVVGTTAVVNDRVYAAADNGTVYALSRDGDLLWQTTLNVPALVDAKVLVSPLVTNRTVIIGDLAGQIHGLDVETGEVRWTTRPPNPGPVFGDQNPFQMILGAGTMVGNHVAFGVSSLENFLGPLADPNYPGYTFRGNVVTLDPTDGRIVWQTFTVPEATGQPDGSFGPSGATVWGTPAYDRASNTLFVGTGQHYGPPSTNTSDALMALDAATGTIKWVSQKTPDDTWNITFGLPDGNDLDFGDSPQLYRLDGRLVVAAGQKSGVFHVVDAETGAAITPPQQYLPSGGLGGFHTDSAVAGGVNYAPGNHWDFVLNPPVETDFGAVFAISGDGSTQLWKFDTDSPIIAGVAVANGVVYVQEIGGVLHAIEAATGQELVQVETGSGTSGPAISRGQIYLGDGQFTGAAHFFGERKPGYIMALGLPDKHPPKQVAESPGRAVASEALTAQEQISFQASGRRYAVSVEQVPGGVHAIVVIPDGESTLGNWEGSLDLIQRGSLHGAQFDGTLTLNFGGSRSLSMAITGRWDPRVGDFGGYVGTYTVSSGTGPFDKATGSGSLTAVYLDADFVDALILLDGCLLLP